MKIYIVRHGQTEWNVVKKMQGSIDIELNNQGKEQAYHAQELLSNKNFDIIITSPLKRAKETAEIINEKFNKEIIIDNRLKERNYGEFEGTQKSSFGYNAFWDYNLNNQYEKAENIVDFYNRTVDFIEDIKSRYSDKNILISTHAGFCKIIEFYLNGIRVSDGKLGPYLPANSEIIEYDL